MDHIFGDSHDIAFGANNTNKSSSTSPIQTPSRKVHHDDFGDLDNQSSHSAKMTSHHPIQKKSFSTREKDTIRQPNSTHNQYKSAEKVSRPIAPASAESNNISTLNRLIDGMKSSFLPREEDTSILRMVALSSPDLIDPLFLLSRDDTTVLIGSGFGTMIRAGQEYPTFPDMRLVTSEKSRLSAWILLDSRVDVRLFQTILPGVGFPPIYATRDIIAKFRNTITDTQFLSQCRFFELFADGMMERRIGDIEYIFGKSLIVKSGDAEIAFSHYPLGGTRSAPELIITHDTYSLGIKEFLSGEIMLLRGTKIEKHSMKFTFDTFFLDKNSVGVVAGYTLGDREQLAENGVLMFTLEEDTRARTISGHIFIDSRGFVHAHEMMAVHKEILKGIRSTYEKLIVDNPKIDRGSLVQSLRREITKYCYLLTGRTPVVMPILIER